MKAAKVSASKEAEKVPKTDSDSIVARNEYIAQYQDRKNQVLKMEVFDAKQLVEIRMKYRQEEAKTMFERMKKVNMKLEGPVAFFLRGLFVVGLATLLYIFYYTVFFVDVVWPNIELMHSPSPSSMPSISSMPSMSPSISAFPSTMPSTSPSSVPSEVPSISTSPSSQPSDLPSSQPSPGPSFMPSISLVPTPVTLSPTMGGTPIVGTDKTLAPVPFDSWPVSDPDPQTVSNFHFLSNRCPDSSFHIRTHSQLLCPLPSTFQP